MGVAFSSIPGIGAISTWGNPGTYGYLRKLRGIAAYREFSVPRGRTNSKYVKYDAAGSSTGGGGAGTYADPYKVRHMADLRTLFSAQNAANTAWYLRNGDVFSSNNVNAAQGLVNAFANVSIQGYSDPASPSTEKPIISGFCNVTGGVLVSGNTYEFTVLGIRPYWVRAKLAGTSYRAYRDQPYKRMSSAAAVLTEPYSYYDDGVSVTRVNFGAHDITTAQFAYAQSAGINLADYDSCGVFGIVSEGWGCESMGSAGGGNCIRAEASGNNEQLIVDCEACWGPYHTTGHMVTGTGGIVSWIRCRWGLFGWQSGAGDGDNNVAFASNGDHESLRWGCVSTHGGLPAEAIPTIRGNPFYGHANTGIAPRLVVIGEQNDVPIWGTFSSCTFHGECPDVTTTTARRTLSNYRLFVHRHAYRGGGGFDPDKMRGVFTNCDWTVDLARPATAFGEPHSAGATAVLKGVFINCKETINLTGSWSGKRLRYFNATGNHNHDIINGHIRITGSQPDGIDWNYGTYLQTCAMWNTIVSNETGTTDVNLTGVGNHYQEADPSVTTGGLSACALYGVPSAQYDGTPGYKTLTQGQAAQSFSYPASLIMNAGLALPSGTACEFDIGELGRNSTPSKTTIGVIEGRPVTSAMQTSGRLGFASRTRRVVRLTAR